MIRVGRRCCDPRSSGRNGDGNGFFHVANVNHKFPLGRGHQPGKLFRQAHDQFLVLGTIMDRVERYYNTPDVRAGNGNSDYSLDAPLVGSSASFKMFVRRVLDALFPRGPTTLVDTAGQTTSNVKRKFLTVVAKGKQVELFILCQGSGLRSIFRDYGFHGGASRIAKATGIALLFIVRSTDKGRHPEVHMFKRDHVALEISNRLGKERGRMQEATLSIDINGTWCFIIRQDGQQLVFHVVTTR
mmetsp:Transcript_18362/g.35086  ORF Transcript_18362/g.35086 Transcript_18362/m.35086 type:complete len:243 (+) Transcript_18362:882-1610(+)